MVHWNVLIPIGIEVTVDVGLEGAPIVPPPVMRVQVPDDGGVGLFPASVAFSGEASEKQNS